MRITGKDKAILQDLAKKQMEYANTEKNKTLEKEWYLHNDLQGSRPMVTIEEGTFFHEVARPLVCETEKGRAFEEQIVRNLISREDIDDDRATPDYFAVWRYAWFTPFGVDIEVKHAADSIGYEFVHPIRDLEEDFHVLGASKWGYDKNPADLELAHDIFDGIIPVAELSYAPGCSMTQSIVKLMSMETMFTSMYDYPELFHKMMGMYADDWIAHHNELEEAGFFITNNRNQNVPQGSYGQTRDLLSKDGATMKDMWGYFDSQETSGVSPGMFEEMYFPYYKRIMDTCGLVNYGCCEAVHHLWDNCLSKCDNLRKLSISPWCDEEMIGDRLRGTGVIYHRKPSPNLVGAAGAFDEAQFSQHIKATLKAAKGCKLEFSLRDIYSLNGEKGRGKRVVKLIKELIEQHWIC